jgi:uncharacterized membrane protein
MIKNTPATLAAISALLAVGAGAFTMPAVAADKTDQEKCYGVAKAGKNDCAGTAHACAGQAKTSGDANEFISLPKGTCERLSGGSLTPKAK